MHQGEIWWANLPPPAGRRPVILLSRNSAYNIRSSIVVAQVTTTIRKIKVEVNLGPEDGMPRICVANLDTIWTIDKQILDKRICTLSLFKWKQIISALKFAFDI